jgi:hypothetical protein
VAEGSAVDLKEGWLVQLSLTAEGAVKGDEGAQVEAHRADADVLPVDEDEGIVSVHASVARSEIAVDESGG